MDPCAILGVPSWLFGFAAGIVAVTGLTVLSLVAAELLPAAREGEDCDDVWPGGGRAEDDGEEGRPAPPAAAGGPVPRPPRGAASRGGESDA